MNDTARVDYLILANHVEAVNGLLYISGGGWTEMHRRMLPNGQAPMTHLGIGISVAVSWSQTNIMHHMVIQLEDDEAVPVVHAETTLSVGRPPQLPPGTEQHIVLAMPLDLTFPHAGGYRILVSLDSEEPVKVWNFLVRDIPA